MSVLQLILALDEFESTQFKIFRDPDVILTSFLQEISSNQ